MRRISAGLLTVISGGLAAISGCGGSGDGGITPPAQTPAIAIALSPATLDLTQGASGTTTVTLTRSGGFTGAVTVAAEGLPAGVTAASVSIPTGQTSGTLNLSAATTAAVATANATIRATGTGVTAATSSLGVGVKATPSTAGAFTLALAPTTISVAQGATQNVTATIARSGSFTGPVALAVTGAPTGLTVTTNPASVTGTSATIGLAASATLAAGTHTLTVRGTGTGAADQTATVAVTVTAVTTPGTGSIAWKFCGTSGLPLWLAVQDGTGPWTRVTGTADSYSFDVASGKGGVAYVVPTAGNGFDLEVFYGTSTELQGRGAELCGGPVGAGKTVNGSLAGTAPTDIVLATLGRSLSTATGSNLVWNGVASGSLDLVASRQSLTLSGTSVSASLNKMIIRRGLNPAAGSTLPVLDFGAAEAFDPTTKNVTINNLGTDQALVVGSYVTANGTIAGYLTDITGGSAQTRPWKGVPAANQATGDFHMLNVAAVQSLTQVLNNTRNAGVVFKDATDKTVALGPTLTAPTISTIAAAPYVRPRAVITLQTEYNRYFVADYQQGGSSPRKTQVQQTPAYAGGNSASLDVPDLSSVAGFDTNWGLKAGTVVTSTISASGWSGAGGIATTPFVEGATYLSATRMGQFTP